MSKVKILLTFLILLGSFSAAPAQNDFDADDPPETRNQRRPKLLRELNLTPEQISEIRTINRTNRRELRAAQQKTAEARRALDQAIYAENADEETIRQRLRDFQAAQAESIRIRALTEYSIRKVLTPEQLVRFRQLRQDFERFRRERRNNANPMRPRDRKGARRQVPPQNP